MNKVLKGKIIEMYGTQADFAFAIGEDETVISRVIRGRRVLDSEKKAKWATILKCKPGAIFKNTTDKEARLVK